MPALAFLFAMQFGQFNMHQQFDTMQEQIEKHNDFSMLSPLHAILAGIKSLFCNQGFEYIKTIRECCGAAGFAFMSGIPSLIEMVSPFMTLEGDYVVMNLQTCKYLLKLAAKVAKKQKVVHKLVEYVNELPTVMGKKASFRTVEDLKSVETCLEILKVNALFRIGYCGQLMAKKDGLSTWEKFNQAYQIDLIKMSVSHTYYLMAVYFNQANQAFKCQKLKKKMDALLRVFAIEAIQKEGAALVLSKFMTPEQFGLLTERLYEDIRYLRPHMLTLIEAFKIHDKMLASAIGSNDDAEQMYETMLEWARDSKLNRKEKIDGFDEYLQPNLAKL